ncbi:hypothetical protein KCU65_g213, partial [Aureobasidium melanogenum]
MKGADQACSPTPSKDPLYLFFFILFQRTCTKITMFHLFSDLPQASLAVLLLFLCSVDMIVSILVLGTTCSSIKPGQVLLDIQRKVTCYVSITISAISNR